MSSSGYVSKRRHFDKFYNTVLVESGTYLGDGVEDAIKSGFKKIISFEVSDQLVESNRKRFSDNKSVEIIHDTSANMYEYIKDIDASITFWLDGHWSKGITSYREVHCPILMELDQISKHHIKTHTILIDDVRLFGTPEFNNITIQQVVIKALAINPSYKIQFLDGHVEKDILAFSV